MVAGGGLAWANGNPQLAVAASGGTPWHRLGKLVAEENLYGAEMLEFAGLANWDMSLKPVFVNVDDGMGGINAIKVPDVFAVHRGMDNAILGNVGSRYEIVSNEDAIATMEGWLQDGRLKFEAVGALGNGEKVFFLGRIGEDFLVAGKDPLQPFILFYNSFDGKTGLTIKLVTIRTVCANTVTAALKEGTASVTLRHTRTIHERAKNATEGLQLVSRTQHKLFERFNQFADFTVTQEMREKVSEILLPELPATAGENMRERVAKERLRLWKELNESPTIKAAGGRDNAWGIYNWATEWLDWKEERRGMNINRIDADEGTFERRVISAVEGEPVTRRQEVFNYLNRQLVIA